MSYAHITVFKTISKCCFQRTLCSELNDHPTKSSFELLFSSAPSCITIWNILSFRKYKSKRIKYEFNLYLVQLECFAIVNSFTWFLIHIFYCKKFIWKHNVVYMTVCVNVGLEIYLCRPEVWQPSKNSTYMRKSNELTAFFDVFWCRFFHITECK